jgi:ABC-type transport system substrate-binding protein
MGSTLNPNPQTGAELLQADLEKIGIKAQVKIVDREKERGLCDARNVWMGGLLRPLCLFVSASLPHVPAGNGSGSLFFYSDSHPLILASSINLSNTTP